MVAWVFAGNCISVYMKTTSLHFSGVKAKHRGNVLAL